MATVDRRRKSEGVSRSRRVALLLRIRQRSDPEEKKIQSIIEVRHEELRRLIEAAREAGSESPARAVAARRADVLMDGYAADEGLDRVLEHLHVLDELIPLFAPDARLVHHLERELALDSVPGNVGIDGATRLRAARIVESFGEGGSLPAASRSQAEEIVVSLLQRRDDLERHGIARRRVRNTYLGWLSAGLVVGLAIFGGLLYAVDRNPSFAIELLVAAVGGALGGALSGTFRVRDSLERIAELKESRAALFAQPCIGAVAGVIVYALFVSGVVTVKGLTVDGAIPWAHLAVVSFIAGFSERFFLKSLHEPARR